MGAQNGWAGEVDILALGSLMGYYRDVRVGGKKWCLHVWTRV